MCARQPAPGMGQWDVLLATGVLARAHPLSLHMRCVLPIPAHVLWFHTAVRMSELALGHIGARAVVQYTMAEQLKQQTLAFSYF